MTATSTPTIPWSHTDDDFDALWEGADTGFIPDVLATMMKQQQQHMVVYAEEQHTTPVCDPRFYGELNNPLVQAKLRESAGYMIEELYEAINHLKNKPWKKSFRDTDEQKFKEEVADAWHFFLEFHIFAGLSPEEIFRQYFMKTLINIERQNGGY